MIVVMPNGTIETPDMMGEVPLFGQDMVKSIIPFVETNYNVIADKEHRAVAGHSWTTWRADLETLAPTLFK